MSFANYAALKTSIANWLHRDSDPMLIAAIPDLINLAEIRLSSDLNARDMDSRTNLSTTAEYISTPSDLVEVRRVLLTGDPARTLQYRTPDQLSQTYATPQTGKPTDFTVIGEQIQLAPIPDATYTLEITYKQRIPALSDTNTTNWLLLKYPNTYLWASLCEAQPYIMGDPRVPLFEQKYQQAVQVVNSIDWYSGSTMTMKSDNYRG